MPIKYTIEGDVVQKTEEIIREAVPLTEFLAGLTSYLPVSISPMPKGIVHLSVDHELSRSMTARVVVEREPAVRRINYKRGSAQSGATPRSYPIQMPYTEFFFVLKSEEMFSATGSHIIWSPKHWGVFWSKEAITSIEDPVIGARLPNCYPNGTICFGSTNVSANQSFGHFIDAAVNVFFQSEFNMDLSYPMAYESMTAWRDEPDPEAWKSWDMWSEARPMKEWLDDHRGLESRERWSVPQPASMADVPIPVLVQQPSFRTVHNWLAELAPNDRERLAAAIAAPDAEEEETE